MCVDNIQDKIYISPICPLAVHFECNKKTIHISENYTECRKALEHLNILLEVYSENYRIILLQQNSSQKGFINKGNESLQQNLIF